MVIINYGRITEMILIINKSKKDARGLCDMFYFMGILTAATTPHEALSEISTNYRAAVIVNPDTLADKEDFVRRIRSYADIPLFAITKHPDSLDELLFERIIKNSSYAAKIYRYICEYTDANGFRTPGSYKLAGINASINLYAPMYFNKTLPFTKTETMILRTLIKNYPTPTSSKDILKYAFRQTRVPDISNVRTHISVMNKKYRKITSRNIITLVAGKGYLILTPEVIEELAKNKNSDLLGIT